MQITQLPALSRALQTGDVFATEDSNGITRKVDVSLIQPTPLVLSIPTGQWSGSGNDRYITVTASNVTADSVLVPHYDNASAALLNGPVWCVPAAGSFTVHTSAIPSGTVSIMIQFVGTLGEAQYQVLADVYSTSQVDSKIAQSTAAVNVSMVTDNAILGIKKVNVRISSTINPSLITLGLTQAVSGNKYILICQPDVALNDQATVFSINYLNTGKAKITQIGGSTTVGNTRVCVDEDSILSNNYSSTIYTSLLSIRFN